MRPRPSTRVAIFALVVIAAAACNPFAGDDTSPTTTQAPPSTAPPARAGLSIDGVVTLGAVLPLTGDLAQFGPAMQAAVELAVDEVNDAGGLLGKQVVLAIEDSQSTPEGAATALTTLIDASKVDAIVGPASSIELVPALVEQAVAAERVLCTPTATSPRIEDGDDKGMLFSVSAGSDGAMAVVSALLAGPGAGRIAVVRRDDPVNASSFAALRASVDRDFASGPPALTDIVVAAESPDAAAPAAATTTSGASDAAAAAAISPDAAAEAVVASGANAVVLLLTPAEAAPVLRGLFDASVLPSQGSGLRVYVAETLATDELGAVVDAEKPAILNGIDGVRPEILGRDLSAFTSRLRGETGLRVEETRLAAEAYDCAVLLLLAGTADDEPLAMASRLVSLTRDGEACHAVVPCRDSLVVGADVAYGGETGVVWDGEGRPAQGLFEHVRFGDRGQLEPLDYWIVRYDGIPVGATPGPPPPTTTPRSSATAPPTAGKTTTTVPRAPAPTSTTSPGGTTTTSTATTTTTAVG